ncbi:MAG: alpha/beta hydrolase [Oscillospiraceae bacterium]|nr:alpha/beta hydrolase [Oscillospiraceae bacterium]MBR2890159.1 alpha/beta hydrolase [Oscillospiraceae bacterium]
MLFGIQNGTIPFGDTDMDYIRFGTGKKTLVMLPGLGDGLRTVRGMAFPLALMYYRFCREYTVYSFSRTNQLSEGVTTRDMADNLARAMRFLEIERADVFGVSMGGMIAQHLAIDHPELVGKLILTVTAPCSNPIMEEAIGSWISFAEAGDHTRLMDSNLRLIYSDRYYRSSKWLIPMIGRMTKPRSYDRFLLMAQACRTHNTLEGLSRIQSPTLIVAGGRDHCLGEEGSRTMASRIPGAVLKYYPEQGHGLYEEEKTFTGVILAFLKGEPIDVQ